MTLEMDRIAHEAFRSQNYEFAAECFTELLSEHGQKTNWLLGKADSLARSGRLNDAFSAYAHAFRLGEVKEEQLQHLVFSLVENTHHQQGETVQESADAALDSIDMFSCTVCDSFLQEPSTYPCGHTFCKPCIPGQVLRICPTCRTKHSLTGPASGIKPNVLLCSLLKLYFPKVVQANELRREGNRYFKAGKHKEALTKYSLARKLEPYNALIASNMSHVNGVLGNFHEALKDAEVVCKLKPDWPKGFYRKGAALEGLGRLEESLKAYLKCLMINSTLTAARKSLAKVLHNLLTPVQASAVRFNSAACDTKNPNYASSVPSFNLLMLGIAEGSSGAESEEEERTEKTVVEQWLGSSMDEESEASSSDGDSDCSGGLWCYSHKKHHHTKENKQDTKYHISADCQQKSHAKKYSSRSDERKRRRSQRGPLSPTRESDFKVFRTEKGQKCREIDPSLVKADDFECSLCMRLLFKPVTTPCGHTFCMGCLYRSLDHSKMCPLCKDSLADFLAERRQHVTLLTDAIIQKYLPTEYKEREEIHNEEIEELARYKTGIGECEIPVFVCTMAFPSIPCPLHVYEPRYRLMVRQCMQSGTKEFGMSPCAEDDSQAFADFGCMLEIEDVKHLPDGRSIIKTHGGRRYKVNSRSMRDGYNTAKVEFVSDAEIKDEEFEEVKALNQAVYDDALSWYNNLPIFHKTRIADFFGHLPARTEIEKKSASGPAWMWWMTAVLPVSPQAQLRISSLTNVKDRLQALKHFIARMNQMPH